MSIIFAIFVLVSEEDRNGGSCKSWRGLVRTVWLSEGRTNGSGAAEKDEEFETLNLKYRREDAGNRRVTRMV